MNNQRTCNKCGCVKDIGDYYRSSHSPGGFTSACKVCTSEAQKKYNAANKEKLSKHSKEYYLLNRDKVIASVKKYREQNVAKKRETDRKYRVKNKVRRALKDKQYALAHPERVAENKKKYRETHRDRTAESAKKTRALHPETRKRARVNRRARLANVGGRLSKGISERLYKLQRGKCACCGQPLDKDFHLDHIVPIAKGGPNVDANIQLLRSECNHKKNVLHPIDYMQSRGFLL